MTPIGQVRQFLAEWRRRARSRADLSKFDHRDLQDLGMSRCDADGEVRKPFWRS